MQKAQNVQKTQIRILIIVLICYVNYGYSQKKIEGIFSRCNGVIDNGECQKFQFYKNGIFKRNTTGEIGEIDYAKGHYYIKNDSLILEYDLSELKTDDYHKSKFYFNGKDSVKIKIITRNTKNKPLSNIKVLSLKNNIETKSNENGVIEFSLEKKREKIELDVINNSLGYYINIWANRNYEIDVFLRNDNYAVPFKNQTIGYKILEITKNSIKLQKGKHTILLKMKE